MDTENVAIRLKGFIDSQGLSHSQFADRCGIPRPSLSQILSGRNKKVSDVIVGQIHQAFPELSVVWLLFGEGEMISHSTRGGQQEMDTSGVSAVDLNFTGDNRDGDLFTNVNGLNTPQNNPKPSHSQPNTVDPRILELQTEIEKIRKNPRKVSHITVYYDDSTFETFYPHR